MASVKQAFLLFSFFLTITYVSFVNAGFSYENFWSDKLYWRTKPELIKQIEKRKIIATAVKDERWWLKGAGIVNAPADYVFKYSQNYDRLRKIENYFKKVEYDSKSQELYLEQKFLGRIMVSRFFLDPVTDKGERRLYFRMLIGPFKDSEGVILFSDASGYDLEDKTEKCEVAVVGRLKGELKWIPDFAFGFAIEAVMQHVAKSLRDSAEKDWLARRDRKQGVSL